MIENLLGVHALVWVGNTEEQDIERAVEKTKASGFDLLELSLHDLESLDVSAARAAIEAANLKVACSRGLDFEADVSSEDLRVVARGEAMLQRSLEATAQLGSRVLTGALYSALGKYDKRLTRRGRRNLVSTLRDLAREARSLDVSLGLEVCNRYETNVVNTADDAMVLVEDIGEDNIFVHLDTYHMNIEESNLSDPVRRVGDRLGYVHIGENHRGYLGSGSLDFGSFFSALAAINYRGPVTFESFSSTVVSETLSNDLAVWRNMWDDGEDLAVSARKFIHAALANADR